MIGKLFFYERRWKKVFLRRSGHFFSLLPPIFCLPSSVLLPQPSHHTVSFEAVSPNYYTISLNEQQLLACLLTILSYYRTDLSHNKTRLLWTHEKQTVYDKIVEVSSLFPIIIIIIDTNTGASCLRKPNIIFYISLSQHSRYLFTMELFIWRNNIYCCQQFFRKIKGCGINKFSSFFQHYAWEEKSLVFLLYNFIIYLYVEILRNKHLVYIAFLGLWLSPNVVIYAIL